RGPQLQPDAVSRETTAHLLHIAPEVRTPDVASADDTPPWSSRALRTLGEPQSRHLVALVARETDRSRQGGSKRRGPLSSALALLPDFESGRCPPDDGPHNTWSQTFVTSGSARFSNTVWDPRPLLVQASEPRLGDSRKTKNGNSHRADAAPPPTGDARGSHHSDGPRPALPGNTSTSPSRRWHNDVSGTR
ncbi:unnamed protein product, partial [Penicillium discolor]